ncbi:Rho-binding antiterminator [Escherichia fergusonii]|uniref:Rho-binding antiterminator n=1 Tax=Escherichia fergusonii TaxID=564 RepID=UPI0002E3E5C7|nr:Rho-binding antiterminator [Escherichia fergusonii]
MSMNDTYQPINCDDYDNLELACQHHLMLTLELKDGETRELRLDKITSFSHPEIGTVVVSES